MNDSREQRQEMQTKNRHQDNVVYKLFNVYNKIQRSFVVK